MNRIALSPRRHGARESGRTVLRVTQSLLVWSMRAARRLAGLSRLFSYLFHGSATGLATSGNAAAKGYADVVNGVLLLDRPVPLSRFERAIEREATLIEQMARLAANAVVENFIALKETNSFACAMRDQHAKSHGCVEAELIVRDDLPIEFATGLFRPGARYPAILRFSNGNGRPQSDAKLDGRGLSIKLRDVEGQTILRNLAPERTPPGEHDFLFSSFPVFFCKDVVDYSEFMEAVTAPHGSWREKLRWAVRWLRFALRHPRQFVTFFRVGLVSISNPLTATYHSMSPYLYGGRHLVRYRVCPPVQDAEADSSWLSMFRAKSPDYLKSALLRDLMPPGDPVELEFSIQVRHAPGGGDAEDASLWWSNPLDRTVRLGRLRIPRQHFDTPERRFEAERLMFNPWNCLPEHRPVGSINRMRLAVYLASMQVRSRLNMVHGGCARKTGP